MNDKIYINWWCIFHDNEPHHCRRYNIPIDWQFDCRDCEEVEYEW